MIDNLNLMQVESALSGARSSTNAASSGNNTPFDEADYYPKLEDNIDRKLVRFFDFGRRLKVQIKAMHTREKEAL